MPPFPRTTGFTICNIPREQSGLAVHASSGQRTPSMLARAKNAIVGGFGAASQPNMKEFHFAKRLSRPNTWPSTWRKKIRQSDLRSHMGTVLTRLGYSGATKLVDKTREVEIHRPPLILVKFLRHGTHLRQYYGGANRD